MQKPAETSRNDDIWDKIKALNEAAEYGLRGFWMMMAFLALAFAAAISFSHLDFMIGAQLRLHRWGVSVSPAMLYPAMSLILAFCHLYYLQNTSLLEKWRNSCG